jgi:hypothetical protein
VSAPQFTPGPWESIGTVVRTRIPETAGFLIADCPSFDHAPGTAYANGRLIAAAPDLYAFASKFVARGGYVSAELAELATEARAILDRVDGVRP